MALSVPGAGRGPQAGSPTEVVDATGSGGALSGKALDYAAESFRITEAGRARSLLDMLSEVHAQITEGVPADLLKACDPGRLRLSVVGRFYRLGRFPVANGTMRLGWPWIVRQTPLRDDLARWCLGLARYAALRIAERLFLLGRG